MNLAERLVPWEDESVPFPANLGLTWWDCLVSPDRFFARVAWEKPFVRPLLYYLILTILAGLLGLFWFVWSPWGAAEQLGLTLELQLLSFFVTPFALLLALGLITLMQHLFVVLLVPDRRGFGATATVLCYGSGVGFLKAILPPALGLTGSVGGVFGATYLVLYVMLMVAVLAWYVVVVVTGVRRAHSTTTGRAAAVVLLPMAIGLVLAVAFIIVALALLTLADFPV